MKRAIITVDLGFGDSGKGATVDYLTHKLDAGLVIRYSGGPQCGHNVKVGDNKHCFSQFGSGSFSYADTLLMDTVVVNPLNLHNEAEALNKLTGPSFAERRMFIHKDCLITTPFHMAWNRIEERKNKHGSCGQGFWKTIEYAQEFEALTAGALSNKETTRRLLSDIQQNIQNKVEKDIFDDYTSFLYENRVEQLVELYYQFSQRFVIVDDNGVHDLIKVEDNLIFEANQGVLLDESCGFHPYVSGSCTTKNAEKFLKYMGWGGEIYKLGICRSYTTRHGNGPLPSYDPSIISLRGEDNKTNDWQNDFKVGPFDLPLMRYATVCQDINGLVVNCLDNDPFETYLTHYPSFNLRRVPQDQDEQIANTKLLEGINPTFKYFNSGRGGIERAAEIAEMLGQNLVGCGFGQDRQDRFIRI